MSKEDGSFSRAVGGRFKKGHSGNPKGRPKGRKNKEQNKAVSAFDVIVDKTLTVTRKGVTREITLEEGLQHQTYKDALAGNRAARREVLKMVAKREAYLADQAHKRRRQGPEVTTQSESEPTNADQALLRLGIARRDTRYEDDDDDQERLQLETWAVQAALNRRRGGQKLTENDISSIKRCTHEASSLRWPRGTDE